MYSQLLAKGARERDITTSLQQYQKGSHLHVEGESLPINLQVYVRTCMCKRLLKATIPLSKSSSF